MAKLKKNPGKLERPTSLDDLILGLSQLEEISVPIPGAEDVLSFAAETVSRDPHKPFVLKADRNVPYRYVDRVIDALKQARAEVIYLLSEQETVDSATSGE